VLRLRFVDVLTQSDIAERIGVSQMQVSRILRSTLTRLRTRLESSLEDAA
jgi:RNA polymerase sigma-B factor